MKEISGVDSMEDRLGKAYEVKAPFFDLEDLCPLDLIRIHTKTADIPVITDEQLKLYRKAAFEGALQYSTLFLGKTALHTQTVRIKRPRYGVYVNPRRRSKIKLKYPASSEIAFMVTSSGTTQINAEVGRKYFYSPTHDPENLLGQSCCSPCNNFADDSDQRQVMYYSGFTCVEDVPAGIIVGMLKFIAWNAMNPGDEIMTVRNRRSIAEAGLTGTNNAAWASGALEMWRQYDEDAY